MTKASAKHPDKNQVTLNGGNTSRWDSYEGKVQIDNGSLDTPNDAKPGDTIHIIIEASDDGSPKLTGYQLVIVTVE